MSPATTRSTAAAAAAAAADTSFPLDTSHPNLANIHNNDTSLLSPSSQWTPATVKDQWSVEAIRSELRQAVPLLSHACLKNSAKWASEQILGLPEPENPTSEEPTSSQSIPTLPECSDREWYAKSLFELGEYAHAAAVLSEACPDADVKRVASPRANLTSYGVYLRAYALYLAGERRKEETLVELRDPLERTTVRNHFLPQLRRELQQAYQAQQLDAFGLYVYGLVLLKSPPQKELPAHTLIVQSLQQLPTNWSAWLDLAGLCLSSGSLSQTIEASLQHLQHHYMYTYFCVEVLMKHQSHDEALVCLERLHGPPSAPLFQHSTHLQAQVAVAHYHLRDFQVSHDYFSSLLEQDPHRIDQLDVYSNILFVQEDRPALSKLAHLATQVDKYRPETCCIVGNYYSLLGKRTKAVQYFQRALKLNPSYTSAWTLMGHEYVELKNTPAAMESYRRAVDVSPQDYRAWYGLGQTYEFLDMHLYALFYFRKAASLRPYDARMWCAMGGCFLQLGRKDDAIQSFRRAMSQEDVEGIATQKLAALYRQDGNEEEAAKCYMRHLEFRYQATAPHEPTESLPLQVVLSEVVVHATEAEALCYLAHYHRDHGEYETAALCCSRLLEYPGPEKEEGKALLREIRSRRERSSGPPESPRRPGLRPRSRDRARRSKAEQESLSMDFSP